MVASVNSVIVHSLGIHAYLESFKGPWPRVFTDTVLFHSCTCAKTCRTYSALVLALFQMDKFYVLMHILYTFVAHGACLQTDRQIVTIVTALHITGNTKNL